jgi:hypothetical protein
MEPPERTSAYQALENEYSYVNDLVDQKVFAFKAL